MDTLSITEALFAQAVVAGYDETTIIPAVRRAQAVVMEYTGGVPAALGTARMGDEVDGILILASENGARDLFA